MSNKDQVHRDLVANLSDEEALQKMHDGWLAAEDWGPAIERVRTQRFSEHSVAEGNRLVGLALGERFLASDEAQLLRVSVDALPRQGVFGKLVPMMGERLRHSIRFEWIPSDSGGLLRILGKRATPAEVTFGFLQAVAGMMSPPPTVVVVDVEDELMTIRVDGL